jgi:UDP-N-acetylglucosamine--N-acetylmuramyl-(pentapeptide) pyrophosphoryl-undecaprenol N-acetylglucosamine transferase
VKVVLTGGGTGGHIYPALSVAECLAGHELLYVGTAEGPEAQVVPRAGLPFRAIPSRKLSRRPTPGAVAALAVSAWGVARAAALLRSWKPDVVLGTGGYASAGVMFAAALLRIPTVVHEANVVPGRVNRLLAALCTRVAVTYPASARYFPESKTVVTGLPVRPELRNADPARARKEYGLAPNVPTLLISGGSGGAQTLNRAVLEALPELARRGLRIVHQTGKSQFQSVREMAGDTYSASYRPVPYVEDMPSLLAAASLIVCRGGSSTLAEVTAVGLPAIVVPYPYAVADHQTSNAAALAEAGAGIMVRDAEFDGRRLVREVDALLGDPARLEQMRHASRGLGRPDAAREVADLLRDVAAGRSRQAERSATDRTSTGSEGAMGS